jgi:hypothetical protein
MGERKMNPESETFFGSPHLPFCHLLFYPVRLRPKGDCAKQSQLGRQFPVDSGQCPAKRARRGTDRAKRTQFATAADIPVFHYSIIPPFPPEAFVRNKANFGTAPGKANYSWGK